MACDGRTASDGVLCALVRETGEQDAGLKRQGWHGPDGPGRRSRPQRSKVGVANSPQDVTFNPPRGGRGGSIPRGYAHTHRLCRVLPFYPGGLWICVEPHRSPRRGAGRGMQRFRSWPPHAVGAVARPDRSFPPRPGLTQVAARGVCARPLGPSMPPGNHARPGRPRGCKAGGRAGSLLRGQGCRRFFRRTPGPQGAGQRSRPTRSEGGVASRDRGERWALRPSRGSGVLDGGGVAAQLAKPLPRRRPARSGQKATPTLAATRERATGEGRRAQRRAKLAEPAGRSAGPRRARDQGDDVSTTGTPPGGTGGDQIFQVQAAARGWRGGLAAPGGAVARAVLARGGARCWRATPGQP